MENLRFSEMEESRAEFVPFLQNKGVQKLKLSKNVNRQSCSPNLFNIIKRKIILEKSSQFQT